MNMKTGVAYYPEYYHERYWSGHLDKIKNAGISRIRFGEFAWASLEPHQGKYNWEWMDRAIELAGQYGIEVMLGTPTACPPIWLVERYPDVLPVDAEGRRTGFGARQHRCYNSPAYLEHSSLIVEALASRYGSHPSVVAWQIDNELGGEQKMCYCSHCQHSFQSALQGRYGSIDELNNRWGTVFWSQQYQDFNQIPVPSAFASDLPMQHHPSLRLEFARFCSNSIIRFSDRQASIIRTHSDRLITTNADTFRWGDNVDLYRLFQGLDIASIDIYSDLPYELGFYFDLMRGVKRKPFWTLEFDGRSTILEEAMKLAAGRSCEYFSIFNFTPFPWGQEQGHFGLLSTTGKELPNYYTVQRWNNESFQGQSLPNDSSVAIYYDFDSSWVYSLSSWYERYEDKWTYPKAMIHALYRSLFEEAGGCDFIFEPNQLNKYDTVILPWHIVYSEQLESALLAFIENGGKLITTADLFRKNRDNVLLTEAPEFFRTLKQDEDPHFPEESLPVKGNYIFEKLFGKGEIRMTKLWPSLEEWKQILRESAISR